MYFTDLMRPWLGRFAVGALCVAGVAHGEERSDLCPGGFTEAQVSPPPSTRVGGTTPGPIRLRADSASSLSPDVTELKGNVDVTRDGEQIKADYLRHDRATNEVDARGNVILNQPNGARFTTGEAHMDLDTRAGFIGSGTYRLPSQQGRGDMRRAEFLDENRTRLSDVRFTTCPVGDEDWALRARTLDFDTAENSGVARHTTFEILGVPFMYVPYFRFPLSNARQSGFLIPQFGYSTNLGTVVGVPYYWNIAPNYDATLTPRVMSDRGTQVQTEFRYLGATLGGNLQLEYLPNDKVTGENRAAGTFWHRQNFNRYWSGGVDLRGVSDKDYLSDFGNRLSVTSESHLPQNAELNYRDSIWAFTTRVADYQTVDRTIPPESRPYARLPQLLLSGGSQTDFGARYRLDSEFNHFDRVGSITGQRVNVAPAINYPMSRLYGFLTPEIGGRYIGYSLDHAPQERDSVSAPYFSLDSGLFFDRQLAIGETNYNQTLEPRLYYLYVPYRNQDQLPTFDTSLPDFSFANLFRNNRFVGGDRIGDANQLTVALTSRLLDERDGVERFTASVGRIHYFEDRRVNIPSGSVGDTSSDVAAEMTAWLARNWHARASVQWTPELDQAARSTYYIQHQPAANKILNVGYRFIRNEVEQSDVSAEWPLSSSWTLRGRSLYSLRDNENVESYVGAQYNSCCWAIRLYGVRRLVQATSASSTPTEQRRGYAIEFELTGLSGSNGSFESPLRQGLFSFAPPTTRPASTP